MDQTQMSDQEVSQENRLWPVFAIPCERALTSIKTKKKIRQTKKGYTDNLSEKEGTQYEAGTF